MCVCVCARVCVLYMYNRKGWSLKNMNTKVEWSFVVRKKEKQDVAPVTGRLLQDETIIFD
jgi:hypothetical protein